MQVKVETIPKGTFGDRPFHKKFAEFRQLLWNEHRRDRTKYKEALRTISLPLEFKQIQSAERAAILDGDLSVVSTSRVNNQISVFVSSTFTDTQWERDVLVEDVHPFLVEFASMGGIEYIPSEMRWGIRDEATAKHLTSAICMNEMHRVTTMSSYVTYCLILTNKYGYRPFPSAIPVEEFTMLVNCMTEDDREFAFEWFRKDLNCLPPHMMLRHTTEAPKGEWWNIFCRLQAALRRAAVGAGLPQARAQLYRISVTHDEILHGLGDLNLPTEELGRSRAFVADRTFVGCPTPEIVGEESAAARAMADTEEKKIAQPANFFDMDGDAYDNDAQTQLATLRNQIQGIAQQAQKYEKVQLQWGPGINLNQAPHRQWIVNFCDDFCDWVMMAIVKLSQEQYSLLNDELYMEALHHHSLARAKIAAVEGRDEMIAKIAAESTPSLSSSKPIVISGESGTGKTSIIAAAAAMVKKTHPGAVLLIRFLGTTAHSASALNLLRNLCLHLAVVYPQTETRPLPADQTVCALSEELGHRLQWATAEKPLLLFLDSLDQLADTSAMALSWIPSTVPAHVRLVVSTLPDDGHRECMEYVSHISETRFEVGKLPDGLARNLLDTWLAKRGRTVQPPQAEHLLASVAANPIGLHMALCFDMARHWSSSTDTSTLLAGTIPELIAKIFEKLEVDHGKLLVGRSLGLLTLAADYCGISSTHMADLLSLDGEVLGDVLQYWDSPITRIPPLLWVKLRGELQEYLTDRGSFGVRVYSWFHRQFWQQARAMYLQTEETKMVLHSQLSELFSGAKADVFTVRKITPVLDVLTGFFDEGANPDNLVQDAARVAPLRKHALCAYVSHSLRGTPDLVVQCCHRFVNMDWLYTILEAHSVNQLLLLLRDVATSHSATDFQEAVSLIYAAVLMSKPGLEQDPLQLYTELPDRLTKYQKHGTLSRLLDPANWRRLYPGREAKLRQNPHYSHLMWQRGVAQVGGVSKMVLGKIGGKMVMSGDYLFVHDFTQAVRVVDVSTGTTINVLKVHEKTNVTFCFPLVISPDAKTIYSTNGKEIVACDVRTGQVLRKLTPIGGSPSSPMECMAVTLDGKKIFSGDSQGTIVMFNLDNGEQKKLEGGHSQWNGFIRSARVTSLLASNDGKFVYSASEDRKIITWDVEMGKNVQERQGESPITCLLEHGTLLFAADDFKGITVYEGTTIVGRFIIPSTSSTNCVLAMTVTKDGKLLFCGTAEGQVLIYAPALVSIVPEKKKGFLSKLSLKKKEKEETKSSYQLVKEYNTHGDKIRQLLLDVGEKYLYCSGTGIHVWDVTQLCSPETVSDEKHRESIAVSLDSKLVCTTGPDSLTVWDAQNGTLLSSLKLTESMSDLQVAFGNQQVIVGFNDTIKTFDHNLKMIRSVPCKDHLLSCMVVSPDGAFLATSGKLVTKKGHQPVVIWDVKTMKRLHELATDVSKVDDNQIFDRHVHKMAWSTDSSTLFCHTRFAGKISENTIVVFDVQKGVVKKTFSTPYSIPTIDVCQDGKTFVVQAVDETKPVFWKRFSTDTYEELASLPSSPWSHLTPDFTRVVCDTWVDNRCVMQVGPSMFMDQPVEEYRKEGCLLCCSEGSGGGVLSPDGKTLVTSHLGGLMAWKMP